MDGTPSVDCGSIGSVILYATVIQIAGDKFQDGRGGMHTIKTAGPIVVGERGKRKQVVEKKKGCDEHNGKKCEESHDNGGGWAVRERQTSSCRSELTGVSTWSCHRQI